MSDNDRSDLSRANQLRQKRQQSSQERVNTVRQQVKRPAPQARTTTTMRRTSQYATPRTGAVRTAPARKLHYGHDANGAELRMPALPTIQFNWQTASVFLAFSLLLLVILLTSLDTFRVSAVTLKGAQRVTASDVTPVVMSATKSIFTLDRVKTTAAIQSAFPEFSAISLKVALPNKLTLSVKERQPILAWTANGQTQWIASDGVVMPARGDGGTLMTVDSSVAVPAASIISDKAAADTATTAADASTLAPQSDPAAIQYVDPQILKAAISLSAQLPSGATLVYDPVSGMGWNDPQGWQVYFGLDLNDIAFKQSEYQAIIQRLQALGIQPSLISVAHVDSPFYRTE
ncbi:MAG: cell division protein FtsQ/DivIB [Anaerolineaceae bacterium]